MKLNTTAALYLSNTSRNSGIYLLVFQQASSLRKKNGRKLEVLCTNYERKSNLSKMSD